MAARQPTARVRRITHRRPERRVMGRTIAHIASVSAPSASAPSSTAASCCPLPPSSPHAETTTTKTMSRPSSVMLDAYHYSVSAARAHEHGDTRATAARPTHTNPPFRIVLVVHGDQATTRSPLPQTERPRSHRTRSGARISSRALMATHRGDPPPAHH